ncbi:MAG: hypothetical protein K5695_05180 [Oscillospiraceae bacterium]|nr:hypothetical protein [Oscillospiraceae bacterium]
MKDTELPTRIYQPHPAVQPVQDGADDAPVRIYPPQGSSRTGALPES